METELADSTFDVGGQQYRLEPLSWMQNKWLGEHIFRDIDLSALDYGTIHDILRDRGPLFMAICLLPHGVTRADHSRLPWGDIQKRAQDFAVTLTGEEVAKFGPRFFYSNHPATLSMLLTGKRLVEQVNAQLSPVPGASGSSEALSPLPMATLPSTEPSPPSGDQEIANRSCNAVSSADTLIGAS